MSVTADDMHEETQPVLKTLEELTDEERADIKVIRDYLSRYESVLENEESPDARESLEGQYRFFKRQEELLQELIRRKHVEKKRELETIEKDDKHGKLVAYFNKFLEEHDIYYIASQYVYMEYFKEDGHWVEMRPEALHKQYNIRGKDLYPAFEEVMSTLGRKKVSIQCSFYPVPDRDLNLMRRDHWLQPAEGTPHYAFDLLIKSLGNDKQENMDHIEQIVYWKYTHPEEFRLPCLVISGEGGVGKNTFVKELLGTVFGQHQVLVADVDKTLGPFNGLIQGKTVVMIDEAIGDKMNAEKLKRIVGNKTIDINPKYGKQGEHDNTALYLAGGNDHSGAVLLANDATDRRWSIITVDKSIIQRLMDDKNLSKDDAVQEYNSFKHVYSEPEEVAKWLHYIMEKWSELESHPVGLHKEDYEALLEVQKSPLDELLEIVFLQPDFQYIEGQVLYEMYQDYVKVTNPSAAYRVLGRNKFFQHVLKWAKKNEQDITKDLIKIRDSIPGVIPSTAKAFIRSGGIRTFDTNRGLYVRSDDDLPYWERAKPIGEVDLVEVDNDEIDGDGIYREKSRKR